jgi:hypothetical protein
MPLVDIIDDTYVAADPSTVARHVTDPAQWRRWWPDLRLSVSENRGEKGVRWRVSGALAGTSEIWLEPWADGVLVHFYLRADPVARLPRRPGPRRRHLARVRRRLVLAWKRDVNALKDAVEDGRPPGVPPRAAEPREATVRPGCGDSRAVPGG